MIGVNDRAPDVELTISDGEVIRLADLVARGPVVVFFYPKDNTPGCTAEACSFRDAYAAMSDAGAQVVGISADSVSSHMAFAQAHGLPFPLASDPDGRVRKAFGVPKALGLLPGRVTYVIDRGGVVRLVFNSMFAPQKHVDSALAMLATLTPSAASPT
jgi:peroxiredoxin Q/BCP